MTEIEPGQPAGLRVGGYLRLNIFFEEFVWSNTELRMHQQHRKKPRHTWLTIHKTFFKFLAFILAVGYFIHFHLTRIEKEDVRDRSVVESFDEKSISLDGSWSVVSPVVDYESCRSEETVLQYAIRNGMIRRKVSVRIAADSNRRGLVADEQIAANQVYAISAT
jgi:hypothetical protein